MEILNQFGINPLLLAAQVVNFFILLFILKKLLYKPILKVLEERKKRIEQSLKNADAIELQLQKTQEESDKILAHTAKEAQKVLDQAREGAHEIIADAGKHGEQIIMQANEEGKKIIKQQQQVLLDQMKENAGRLVVMVAEKIFGKELIGEKQKKIIEKQVKNLS